MENKKRKPIWVYIMAGVLGFAIIFFGMITISNIKMTAIITEIQALRADLETLHAKAGEAAAENTAAFTTLLLAKVLEAAAEPKTIPLGPEETAEAAPEDEAEVIPTVETIEMPHIAEPETAGISGMAAEMSIMDTLISLPADNALDTSDEEGWEDVAVPGAPEAAEESAETAPEGEETV